MRSAAVIGSGIGGLAAAIRLATQGFKTTVFEATKTHGGKMGELQLGKYRFDTGPSVFTMPEFVDELFYIANKDPRDYWNYSRLNPVFNYFFEDGTLITAPASPDEFAIEIERKTGEPKENVLKLLQSAARKHDLTDDVFLQKSLHIPSNYLSKSTLKGILNFAEVEAFTRMNASNTKRFQDPRVVRLFNQYAAYNGSDPFQAPATLNIIAHFQVNLGTYFPNGGMRTISNSLFQLAKEVGVSFNFNTPIEEIVLENKTAVGVVANQALHKFDVIASNMDVYNTYHKLLPKAPKPVRSLNQPKSSSVIVFYWGIKKHFSQLHLHNMFFSKNGKEEYQAIFNDQTIPNDPTIYLNISCKKHSLDAPHGCENWFTMITVPHNTGQKWDDLIAIARDHILKKLSRVLNENIQSLIECEEILDPRKLEHNTGSAFGSVYGNSFNSGFSAFFRHPNFSRKIKNLYFCGGSVHPGGSIPLSLLSAKIVGNLV